MPDIDNGSGQGDAIVIGIINGNFGRHFIAGAAIGNIAAHVRGRTFGGERPFGLRRGYGTTAGTGTADSGAGTRTGSEDQ